MKRIGLTGGIACGKTTVAQMLARNGAFVVSADDAAREALRKGSSVWHQTVRIFGKDILTPSGEINRKKLATIVFGNARQRARLESIVHPQVRRIWRRALAQANRSRRYRVAVADIPLLYEVNLADEFDAVLVVGASRQTQLARQRQRGLTQREAQERIAAQWPLQRKVDAADYVIWNDGTRALLRRQVCNLWKKISANCSRV